MSLLTILTPASLIANIVQFFIGLDKDRRLRKYQEFEYKAHLQLIEEELTVLQESFGYALCYSAKIKNCGSKLVQISAIRMNWDPTQNTNKHRMDLLAGEFYLTPGEEKPIVKMLLSEEVKKIGTMFGSDEYRMSLQLDYIDARGEPATKIIGLAKFKNNGEIITRRWSDIIA